MENLPLVLLPEEEMNVEIDEAISDTANALAAVHRLTTLFADLPVADFEVDLDTHFDDPMLAAANVELDNSHAA